VDGIFEVLLSSLVGKSDGRSSDRLWAADLSGSGPNSEDPPVFPYSELQVQAACALLPLQENVRGTGGGSTF